MKNLNYILFILAAFIFTGCEDVVDVDLKTDAPRLVIDASINWQKGTSGSSQVIRLTTTTSYFNTEIPPATGAEVFVTDANNSVFVFTDDNGTGYYRCENFVPELNMDYILTVNYEGQTYTASETLKPVPVIDTITQVDNGGFSGEDIEIKVFFTDNGATEDYYLVKYFPDFSTLPELDSSSDEFYQGNQFFGLYIDEDLKSGSTLGISLESISRQYYNYLVILNGITGGGGPFGSPPANLKGNVINNINFENYALGYFSVSESDYRDYVVE